MAVTTEDKYKVCHKHQQLLEVINWLNTDGVVLQDQLQQILTTLQLYKNNIRVVEALRDLEKHEVIKKIRVADYRSQFIMLKKFAWRYLLGKTSSQEVRATRKKSLNQYTESVYKTQLIIDLHLSSVSDFSLLEEHMTNDKSTLLFNKGKGLEWFQLHKNDFDTESFRKKLHELEDIRKKALDNLGKGGDPEETPTPDKSIIKASATEKKKKKRIDFQELTLDSLLKRNVHIKKIDNGKIEFIYFDLGNSQSLESIAVNYYIANRWAKEVFKIEDVVLEVCAIDEGAVINLNRLINTKGFNYKKKEIAKYTPIQNELMKNKYVGFSSSHVEETPTHILTYNLNIRKYLR